MSTFFPKRSFFIKDGKLYYLRGRAGPTYQVTSKERDFIIQATRRLHLKMAALIFAAFGGFAVFVFFLPEVLDLPFDFAMGIMLALTLASLMPLALTLKFHMTLQNQIREILGKKTSEEFGLNLKETSKIFRPENKKPPSGGSLMDIVRKRERKTRFIWVFLLGILLTTLGITMLVSIEPLTTKTLFIWILNLMTGLGFLLVGFLGMIYRVKDAKTSEGKNRK